MRIYSKAIPADSVINLAQVSAGAGGQNISPDLTWEDIPEGTKSFAITIFDPDAPTGSGWWHWVVINIPATITSIPLGGPLPPQAIEKPNDFGFPGYGGPYPPPGPPHRYIHTVHALNVESLDLPEEATNAATRFHIHGSEIARASLTGTFQNQG